MGQLSPSTFRRCCTTQFTSLWPDPTPLDDVCLCTARRGDFFETPYTHLYHGSSGPALNLTLEGQLLSQWSSGSPHYDALFLQAMPPVDQLLSSLAGPGPSLTLLVNQSAVSGLPASLNQATSALLRLMVAAGGAKSSPLPSRSTTGRAARPGGVWIEAPDADGELGTTSVVGSTGDGRGYPGAASAGSEQSNAGRSRSRGPAGARKHQHGDGSSSSDDGSSGSGDTAAGSGSSGASSGGGGHLPSCMPVINAVSSPLPLREGEKAQRVRQDAGALMLVLCMTLAASVLSASFVVFLVR